MELILIPLTYYAFTGFTIVFSIINELDLLLKISKSKIMFNVYIFLELIVSSTLITYSILRTNYALLIIGFVIFISTLGGLWWRESAMKMISEIGNKYDYTGAFTCFVLAALIYFFDYISSIA